jgi:hypothetical protein
MTWVQMLIMFAAVLFAFVFGTFFGAWVSHDEEDPEDNMQRIYVRSLAWHIGKRL